LNLLQERYREQVKWVYIDPPYNTNASAIVYKNGFKDPSWRSLIENRLTQARTLLSLNAITCVAIDDTEFAQLNLLVGEIFESILAVATVRSNPAGRSTPKDLRKLLNM
jgi:adenine-specific DNA-methyltransferase